MGASPRPCRHCQKFYINRPRGLCWRCFYTPGLKELYPPTAPCGRRGHGMNGMKDPHVKPTHHLPLTEEKMAVLEQRAANCQPLFSKDDARRTLE